MPQKGKQGSKEFYSTHHFWKNHSEEGAQRKYISIQKLRSIEKIIEKEGGVRIYSGKDATIYRVDGKNIIFKKRNRPAKYSKDMVLSTDSQTEMGLLKKIFNIK